MQAKEDAGGSRKVYKNKVYAKPKGKTAYSKGGSRKAAAEGQVRVDNTLAERALESVSKKNKME